MKTLKQTTKILCLIFSYSLIFLFIYSPVNAQSLSLSISPPIDEITIIPGRSVERTFTISNNGQDGMASIYLIPFKPQDEYGNVILDEKNTVTETSPYASWFSIVSPNISFGERFYIVSGGSQDVTIKISPPEEVSKKDYYFTLLYELDGDIPGSMLSSGSLNQARIGANILISASDVENPEKTFQITEFSAPKIIDSLTKLEFNIRIDNRGDYVFKPQGEILIDPILGSSETLKIAPLNIISDSIRNIPCIESEEIMSCKSNQKVLIGVYKSTLEVSAYEDSVTQKETVTTVALPFSIIFGLILIFMTYRAISAKTKAKELLDRGSSAPNNSD